MPDQTPAVTQKMVDDAVGLLFADYLEARMKLEPPLIPLFVDEVSKRTAHSMAMYVAPRVAEHLINRFQGDYAFRESIKQLLRES